VHGERGDAGRRCLIRTLLQSGHQCSNSLAVAQFASSILVESSAIAIPF
jgi:hypothetical protein